MDHPRPLFERYDTGSLLYSGWFLRPQLSGLCFSVFLAGKPQPVHLGIDAGSSGTDEAAVE